MAVAGAPPGRGARRRRTRRRASLPTPAQVRADIQRMVDFGPRLTGYDAHSRYRRVARAGVRRRRVPPRAVRRVPDEPLVGGELRPGRAGGAGRRRGEGRRLLPPLAADAAGWRHRPARVRRRGAGAQRERRDRHERAPGRGRALPVGAGELGPGRLRPARRRPAWQRDAGRPADAAAAHGRRPVRRGHDLLQRPGRDGGRPGHGRLQAAVDRARARAPARLVHRHGRGRRGVHRRFLVRGAEGLLRAVRVVQRGRAGPVRGPRHRRRAPRPRGHPTAGAPDPDRRARDGAHADRDRGAPRRERRGADLRYAHRRAGVRGGERRRGARASGALLRVTAATPAPEAHARVRVLAGPHEQRPAPGHGLDRRPPGPDQARRGGAHGRAPRLQPSGSTRSRAATTPPARPRSTRCGRPRARCSSSRATRWSRTTCRAPR